MMRRRDFIAGAGATVTLPLSAYAQQTTPVYRIAHLASGTEISRRPVIDAFKRGMRDLGYVEGQNFLLDARFDDGNFERLPALAAQLLRANPDVLFVATTPASLAAKAATSTIPIVIVSVADPIGSGLIASLANPGGNITGITNIVSELAGKRLQILKELVPTASKVAVLVNPDDPNATVQIRNATEAAKDLAIQLDPILAIRGSNDLKGAFEMAVAAGAGAALRMVDPLEISLSEQTAALATQYRLPVVYPFRRSVEAGGLASYGTDLLDQYRQSANLVHKILKGAKPADLPVEQPTKFELVINRRAAKALGIDISAMLLARADAVIE